MKVNNGKSHLLHSDHSSAAATVDNSYIESEDEQVLLGITTDSSLTFENHINSICKKASQKLNALARITPYMNIKKQRTIIKSYVTPQFSYCPLIWMFHGRHLNNKINSIHERALRITYKKIRQYFKNCSIKTTLFQYIKETCKFWQRKCLRFTDVCLQKF